MFDSNDRMLWRKNTNAFSRSREFSWTQDQPIVPNTRSPSIDQDKNQTPPEIIANSSSLTREYLDKLSQI